MSYTSSSTEFFYVGQRLTDFAAVDVTVARTASGGFGAVAMGPDRTHEGRWFALKILRPDLLRAADPQTQQRLESLFLREALTWVGLWPHLNVLTAHAVTEINGQLMLVLDYATEGSLRDRFEQMHQRGSWLTLATALELAQHIAAGLVALHTPDPALLRDFPIVHRDLKPENILLSQGRAMITDFGLAKVVALALASSTGSAAPDAASPASDTLSHTATLEELTRAAPDAGPVNSQHTQAYHTRQGAALGTPAYMAPEQWVDAVLAREPADAYAFGIILAELLTSRHPLLDLTLPYSLAAWRQAHLAGQPTPLRQLGSPVFAAERAAVTTTAQHAGLDTAVTQLEDLLTQLLAKDPSVRPTLPAAFAALQATARALGQDPYTPPDDFYPHTTEHERIIWRRWANAYLRFDLRAEALSRIERALELVPQDSRDILSYGNILAYLDRLEEAEAACRQSLALRLADDRQGRKNSLNSLGAILQLAGRFAEAEDICIEAVALLPDAANTWHNRANNQRLWALAERDAGNQDAAQAHAEQGLTFIEQALALNPGDPRIGELAQMLHQLRDQVQADANGEEG